MPEEVKADEAPELQRRRRLKRWAFRVGMTLVVVVILASVLLGYAEHRTSQASFCASCHNMVPYYETWQADLHGGKLDIACVECHYAPGERTTLKAKFRGLSQVASYFSGRYGATRPRAHVSNDSCLTSNCHGDGKFMDKPIQLGTVEFTHAKHLRRTEEQEKPQQVRLAEIEKTLKDLVGKERFKELKTVALVAGPAEDRYDHLVGFARQWNVPVERDLLIEFSQLQHRTVRIAQLRDLQCTNCHSYHSGSQDVAAGEQGHHFSVHTTTCFTCHFNNEGFNTGTNRCLLCHDPPKEDIVVHEALTAEASEKLDTPELAATPVKMNHADILAQNVDCLACHADVARGDTTVTRRDCEHCHDQPRFFKDWKEPFTLELVTNYHKAHIHHQRATCFDCHAEIKHSLARDKEGTEQDFLTVALSDCTHCHANPHVEQIKLLSGQGGLGVPKSEPNPMFGARTNCFGCHTESSAHPDGREAIRGTQQTCVACHGDRYADMFEKWKAGVELTLADAEAAYAEARKLLDEKITAPVDKRQKAAELLTVAETDLQLVKLGNGVHNVTYSIELLDSVTTHSRQAAEILSEQTE